MSEGLVIGVRPPEWTVSCGGVDYICRLRGKPFGPDAGSPPIVVGDRVTIRVAEGRSRPEAVITDRLPRRNSLTRGVGERVQVLAANLDSVAVVASAKNPPLKAGLLDRYLVRAEWEEIDALIVINKTDLGVEPEQRELIGIYRKIGYAVVEVSAETGEGIDELESALEGGLSILVGHSGVGKTALSALLSPETGAKVGRVNPKTGKGRHTTSTARLFPISGGGSLVDTPGVREINPAGIPSAELASCFREMAPHVADCRFRFCSHRTEPDCAVKEKVESGEISEQRYGSLVKLTDEIIEMEASLKPWETSKK
jgi:ribosome biogenesis GTPase